MKQRPVNDQPIDRLHQQNRSQQLSELPPVYILDSIDDTPPLPLKNAVAPTTCKYT